MEDILVKLFEHNNWANERLIAACTALTDEQLDATPLSSTPWSIRFALTHVVECQQGYLSLLTLPPEARQGVQLPFAELRESAGKSGAGLLALARDATSPHLQARLRTTDGYVVEPWVVMLQAVNHATDHRRQICGILRALGVEPPHLDGWAFGEVTGALVPVSG